MRQAIAGSLVMLFAVAGAGCQQSSKKETGTLGAAPIATAGATDGRVNVVNAFCAVMDEHPVGTDKAPYMALPENVRTYRGKKVGFCCDDCPAQWDAMTDADRDASLARAAVKKR